MPEFSVRRRRRTALVGAPVLVAVAAMTLSTAVPSNGLPLPFAAKDFLHNIQGTNEAGGAGAETDEVKSALAQFNDARNAPGVAIAGGYTAALDHINQDMGTTAGTWQEMTKVPYNSDDQRYRDYFANTSAGGSYVTGRVQALASDANYVFAGGASGGVFRKPLSADGSGAWQELTSPKAALTTGALAYRAGELWLATGDGSSGGTTYSGNGVFVLTNPDATGSFNWAHLADGDATTVNGQVVNTGKDLFDGSVINQLRFSPDGQWVYAASDYGVWRHSTSDLSTSSKWHAVFVPKPSSLPSPQAGATSNSGAAAVDNYTSDVAVDPSNGDHVVVAYGWVVGGAANGWYDGHRNADGTWTFTQSSVTGSINPKDIGRTTFAWANDSTASGRLYALVHNPDHAATGVSYSELGGVYMSTKGVNGPWSKIADSQKLSQSGSALDPTINGGGSHYTTGYQPGVQAWYNQFLAVDPSNASHVFVGLEEVYETRNAGSNWNTVGPYWNFYFGCWGTDISKDQLGCPVTTHSDQHAVTIAPNGRIYVGNDGGIYSRPVAGTAYQGGHATDWVSETKSSTPDVLQYYALGVGRVNPAKVASTAASANKNLTEIISGGLQDNGGSILFANSTGPEGQMGSDFGGDGGDVLVDPNDGCRIVQEYVSLTMRVTNMCASPTDFNAFIDLSKATSRQIKPPESLAEFTAPFAADHTNINNWIAGGQHVWLNTKGFNIASGSDWTNLVTLGTNTSGTALREATATAASGGWGIVGFCGSCATGAFESGFAFGPLDATNASTNHGWTIVNNTATTVVNQPNRPHLPPRWIAGADVYQDAQGTTHYLLAFSGFGRRWVEGPGAGIGHVFESTDGTNWTDLSGDSTSSTGLPDVPTSAVKHLTNGDLVAGTDLGVFYGKRNSATSYTWTRLGSNLPETVVTDLEPGQDGNLYAATYGRGIWRIPLANLPAYAGGDSCQDTYWKTKQQPASPCTGNVTTAASTTTAAKPNRK